MEEKIKTLRNRIEFHQLELKLALAELFDVLISAPPQLQDLPRTTLRDRILKAIGSGELYTAKEIKLMLIAQGHRAMNVDQTLVGMEKDGLIESDRSYKRKRYRIKKAQ